MDREELVEHVEWLLQEGEFSRAWTLCRRGLRRYPKDPQLWLLLGDSLMDSERYTEAERAFRSASNLSPDWALPVARRAEACLYAPNWKRAVPLATKAYDLDRDLPLASHLRAVCLELDGNPEEAAFWYRRAQKLDSENYFPPLEMDFSTFMQEFHSTLDEIKGAEGAGRALVNTRWNVCEQVDQSLPELAGISPMTSVHLIPAGPSEEGMISQTEDDPLFGHEPPLIEIGFIFRNNIRRNCRSIEEIAPELYMSILDSLDRFFGEDESEP